MPFVLTSSNHIFPQQKITIELIPYTLDRSFWSLFPWCRTHSSRITRISFSCCDDRLTDKKLKWIIPFLWFQLRAYSKHMIPAKNNSRAWRSSFIQLSFLFAFNFSFYFLSLILIFNFQSYCSIPWWNRKNRGFLEATNEPTTSPFHLNTGIVLSCGIKENQHKNAFVTWCHHNCEHPKCQYTNDNFKTSHIPKNPCNRERMSTSILQIFEGDIRSTSILQTCEHPIF